MVGSALDIYIVVGPSLFSIVLGLFIQMFLDRHGHCAELFSTAVPSVFFVALLVPCTVTAPALSHVVEDSTYCWCQLDVDNALCCCSLHTWYR